MMNDIGQRLSQARKSKNLTQDGLSELSGVSTSQISRIENGKSSPTLATLDSLCRSLSLHLDVYICDDSLNGSGDAKEADRIISMLENTDNEYYSMVARLISLYNSASHK